MLHANWKGPAAGLAVGAIVLTAWTGLSAQNRPAGGSGRVVCLDVVKLFNEYQRQKDLTEEMRQMQESLEQENQQRRQRIDALQATLDAMDPTDPAYVGKTREMLEMQIDYKNWFDLKQADMTREVGLWTTRIYQEILKTTEEHAQKNGFDMVIYRDEFTPTGFDPQQIREQIRNRKLLYANGATDVTQPVLDQLNTTYRAQPRSKMLFVP